MDTNPCIIAVQRMQLSIPGIITPSQDSFTFCDYDSYEVELPVKTVRVDEMPYHILTSKAPDLLYWEPAEKFTFNCSLRMPHNIVKLESVVRDDRPYGLRFIALVPPAVVHDGKVIGHYDKAKFPADFNGSESFVGAGQAWLDDSWKNIFAQNIHDYTYSSYNVNVFYDGKIIEAPSFSFLCTHEMPKLSHYTLPELKWETVTDGPLPTNALPAGIFPNGEILYVGKKQHEHDEVPGYVVDTEKSFHLCWNSEEHCYDEGYSVLVVEEPEAFDWGIYFNGEVPSTAIPGGTTEDDEELYIGRTVTNSDVMIGKTWRHEPISLPHGRVTNTQLVGKIHASHKCLYVPWGGKEYIYPSYEVLMGKLRPKSLQHLCRNVIITATLGIPGRVDKLLLPLHLRDFCKVKN